MINVGSHFILDTALKPELIKATGFINSSEMVVPAFLLSIIG